MPFPELGVVGFIPAFLILDFELKIVGKVPRSIFLMYSSMFRLELEFDADVMPPIRIPTKYKI